MNDNAWERLVDAIDIKAGIGRHGREQRPLENRTDLNETVEFIEFELKGEPYRMERITGPAVIDRKSHYSHRGGTASRIENIYDPNETQSRIQLYTKVAGEWEPRETSELSI
jgi:hypothetical protein